MPPVLKVLLALVAAAAGLVAAAMAFVALLYAFSNEMPSDGVVPTAVAGALFGVIALALFALAAWLLWSAVRPAR